MDMPDEHPEVGRQCIILPGTAIGWGVSFDTKAGY